MTVHYDMPADEYHGLPMVSAGLVHDIVGPDGCPALAYARTGWLGGQYEQLPDEIMENGTLIHACVLEPDEFEKRFTIIDASDYRTQKARDLRDDARASGMIPILYDRGPGSAGSSFVKIQAIKRALEQSQAAELLFGEDGKNEVSYTWEIGVGELLVPCKARADRVRPRQLIDLKSAPTASPEGFQRSMVYYGHHSRAAFYLGGWYQQDYEYRGDKDGPPWEYTFVVVQKEPPYLVNVYQLGERALEWGDKLQNWALVEYARAVTTNHWPGFLPQILDLPTWAEHRLADLEAAGTL